MKQEAIVSKYIWQLRRSFSLSVLYEFTRECERSKPKAQTLEAYMDELSELAKSPTYDQEFNMAAKKNAAPVPPPAATKAVSKAVKTATQPVKAAPATKDGSPIREPKVPVTAKLRWLVDANPKRVGSASHERCEGYFGAKTVEEFLEGGGTRADLNNDIEKGYVEVV